MSPPAEPAEPAARRRASPSGIVEYLLVVAFVALAIAGAVAVFGDEIRSALGTPPAPPAP